MSRWRLLLGISLAMSGLTACQPEEDSAQSDDAITGIKNTPVERQTVGNCWIYATMGWAESLHLAATREAIDLSEAYLTYWHVFHLLAVFPDATDLPNIGGYWETAMYLIADRGLMREADFIPEESGTLNTVSGVVLGSGRQKDALGRINRELGNKSSALRSAMRAGNRAGMRTELDKAWRLRADVIADLDKVFGADGRKKLGDGPSPAASKIMHPRDFVVAAFDPDTRGVRSIVLSDTFASGGAAWTSADAPPNAATDKEARRAYERRIQRALHDGMPLPIVWTVDERGKDASGTYRASKLKAKDPSPAAPKHLSLITDYAVGNVPGFGTLAAGVEETRPEALAAALDARATITFFRVKNSWGVFPNDPIELVGRLANSSVGGYNDLEPAYLYATGDLSVVLPPGY